MCKYCELTNNHGNDQTNDVIPLLSIKDGSQLLEVTMNRCITERKRNNELVLDLGVNISGFVYNAKTKEIKIKYCPFCGEKL